MSNPSKARLGAAAIAGAIVVLVTVLLLLTVRIVASLQPIGESDLVGSWGPQERSVVSLELKADGTAVATDLPVDDDEPITGTGTWSLENEESSFVRLAIDDAANGGTDRRSVGFDVEREGTDIVLVDYVGDPHNYDRRIFERRAQ
jgi:hypothetical protein